MEKIDYQQPLNEIIEEEEEETANENTGLLLHNKNQNKHSINQDFNQFFKTSRMPSSTFIKGSFAKNLFVANEGPDDVQSSMVKYTNSIIKRMKYSYQ